MKERRGPNFLCIGPEKTGTSWLWVNLKKHPEIWLPPVKELRYFWVKQFLPEDTLLKRVTGSHWHYRSTRNEIQGFLRELYHLNICSVPWYFRFFLLPRTDSWYEKLFERGSKRDRVTGDITPLYYQLPEAALSDIAAQYPETRILILLRNPVDRAWSLAVMNLCMHRKKRMDEVPKADFLHHFDNEFTNLGSFVQLISRWSRYFGEKNVLVKYYDEMIEEPRRYLASVADFLGVDPEGYRLDWNTVSKIINVGMRVKRDPELITYLADRYRACVEEMIEHGSPYAKSWKEEIEKVLTGQKS